MIQHRKRHKEETNDKMYICTAKIYLITINRERERDYPERDLQYAPHRKNTDKG